MKPYRIDDDNTAEPRLIRRSPNLKPLRYSPQRHRRMLLVISLLIAFLLGLIVMPSNLKKNAIERLIKEQTKITERDSLPDYGKTSGLSTKR